MDHFSGCPEKIELYAFIDGELKEDAFAAVDAHILACAACRDEVRRIKVFHRALFGAVGPETPVGDEPSRLRDADRFLDGLMTRLVDHDAARPVEVRRGILRRPALVAVAVVFLTAAFFLLPLRRPADRVRSDVDAEGRRLLLAKAELERGRALAAAETELSGAVSAATADSAWSWRRHLVRFTDLNASLPAAIDRVGRVGGVGARVEIARRLPGDLGMQAVPVLERFAADKDVLVRTETCRALGRLGAPTGLRLVRAAAKDDVDADLVINAMLKTRSTTAEKAVREFVAARFDGDDAVKVVAALAKRRDGFSTDLLSELYFSGRQSGALLVALRERPAVVAVARAAAFTDSNDVVRRRAAIRLIGEFRDGPSAPRLERFLNTRELASVAARAIAQIGGEAAMVTLARRLQPRARDDSDDDDPRRTAIESAVATFGEDGAKYYLERASAEDGFSAHYVIAAGLSGGAESVGGLERLLAVDSLKGYAVQALGMIADRAGEGVLVKLAKSPNARLRERAIEALKKRRGPTAAPPRRRFVESDSSAPSDDTFGLGHAPRPMRLQKT